MKLLKLFTSVIEFLVHTFFLLHCHFVFELQFIRPYTGTNMFRG